MSLSYFSSIALVSDSPPPPPPAAVDIPPIIVDTSGAASSVTAVGAGISWASKLYVPVT